MNNNKKHVQRLAEKLADYFTRYDSAIIAYSGGVDSSLLAYAAHRVLKDGMKAVLADSPSLARKEYQNAVDFAEKHHIPLTVVKTSEMENSLYLSNQGNRCYYCKKDMFAHIKTLRESLKQSVEAASWPLFYGANMDDLGDHRPGMKAAGEAAVTAPFIDLKMGKADIRAVCRYYQLSVADKPAMPCLSSRIAYGQEVTGEKLGQIEQAEAFLNTLGFRELRVRHHGDSARIEVHPETFSEIMQHRTMILEKFHSLGFTYVSLDLDGLRSGSLNEMLNSARPEIR